jgi:FMN reductase
MTDIVSIAGCSAVISNVNAVLNRTQRLLRESGVNVETISVRHLPAEDLLLGFGHHPSIREARYQIHNAMGIIIATSVHQCGYPGALKAFLDLLPGGAFQGKSVLLLATAPSPAQFFSFDGAVRFVIEDGLGAKEIIDAVYLPNHLMHLHDGQVWLDDSLHNRLNNAVQQFRDRLFPPVYPHSTNHSALL